MRFIRKAIVAAILLVGWGAVGWMAGNWLESVASYGEAERLQGTISVAARNDPELAAQAMDQVGKLSMRSLDGDPIVIVNKHFQLRLNAGRTFPSIERLGSRGAQRNVKD